MGLFSRNKKSVNTREQEYQWKADVLKAVIGRMNTPQVVDGKIIYPTDLEFGAGGGGGSGGSTVGHSTGHPSTGGSGFGSAGGSGLRPPAFEEAPESIGNYSEFTEALEVGSFKLDPKEFVKDFNFNNLYFENSQTIIEMIASALAVGKHVIFYGPPGTGKTSIAKEICNHYGVDFDMVTGTSDWSTFDTIGGYILESGGDLIFNPGLFLRSFKDEGKPANKWLIIDEINRADIDKAFGPMFSALTGDNVTLPQKVCGKNIEIHGKPEGEEEVFPNEYFIHPDWRILATLNTFDKAALYEMSYAFMRRFSFVPIMIPENIEDAVEGLIKVWGFDVDDEMKKNLIMLWKHINKFRKIGPAIVRDLFRSIVQTNDYNGAIIMYVLPQFEGLEEDRLKEFLLSLTNLLMKEIDVDLLKVAFEDFINTDLG